MDNEMTHEQKEKLKTWAEKRDELLQEIAVLQLSYEKLKKSNKELANSSSDIEERMFEIRGRIKELLTKEIELVPLTIKKIANLETKKTVLETEVTNLIKMIEVLTSQKASLESDVSLSLDNFEILKDGAIVLDKVVDHVTVVSKNNAEKIDLLVANLGTSLEELIDVNKKNVFETNIVIDKVPKMIMECQKHGLINKKI